MIQDRICRATGARIQVIDANLDEDFDPREGGRWVTWCATHETFVQHPTRALATYHAADSATWCGQCAEEEL